MISQLNTFLFGHLPFLSKQSSILRINYTFRNLPFWHRYPAMKATSVEDSTDVLVFFCYCCYLPCHYKSDLFSNSLQVFSLAMIFISLPTPFSCHRTSPSIHLPACVHGFLFVVQAGLELLVLSRSPQLPSIASWQLCGFCHRLPLSSCAYSVPNLSFNLFDIFKEERIWQVGGRQHSGQEQSSVARRLKSRFAVCCAHHSRALGSGRMELD